MASKLSRFTERMVSGLVRCGDWENFTDEQKETFIRGCENLSAQNNGMVIFVERSLLKHFPFSKLPVGYSHYGIYVKKPFCSEMVIHYVPDDDGDVKGIVRETSLDDFLDGAGSFEIRTFSSKQYQHIYSGEETVQRARSKLGCRGYDLIFNNCEHFATWCKTGEYRSSQCEKGIKTLFNVAGFLVGGAAFSEAFGNLWKA